MTKGVHSERSLELQIDVDATIGASWSALTEAEGLANWFSPIAKVSNPGLNSEFTAAWNDEMTFTTRADAWEHNRRVRWVMEGVMGPSTAVAIDFHLETAGRKTRIRLVLSGSGECEGWDEFFEVAKSGWAYFLYNLRFYLEKHPGRTRRVISERFQVSAPRATAWKRMASAVTGMAPVAAGGFQVGDRVRVAFDGGPTVEGVAEVVVVGRVIAIRLPELESLLFIDLEGNAPESFYTGWYLSVYDKARAKELEAPARRTFRRIHESIGI